MAQFRIGLVTASIFENEGPNRPFHTVTITRTYRNGEDWGHTNSFSHADLPLVERLVRRCESWIAANQ